MEEATSHWPSVSVIVNTHKGAGRYLRRALDSILAQTYRDFECIVVNDGPEADEDALATMAWATNAFHDAGLPFGATHTEERSGYQCAPKNQATYMTAGDYIAYLDSDNEWLPDHLEVLMRAIEEGEMWPDLVYGRRRYVIDEGAPKEHNGQPIMEGDSEYVPMDDGAVERLLRGGPGFNFIDTSDFVVAKGALYRLAVATGFIWNESIRRVADWELVARGIEHSGWILKDIPNIVTIYHVTGGNVSLTPLEEVAPQKVVAQ